MYVNVRCIRHTALYYCKFCQCSYWLKQSYLEVGTVYVTGQKQRRNRSNCDKGRGYQTETCTNLELFKEKLKTGSVWQQDVPIRALLRQDGTKQRCEEAVLQQPMGRT